MEALRETWRQKRVQRLAARLQSKQKDQSKPLSSKILGCKPVNSIKMNNNSASTSNLTNISCNKAVSSSGITKKLSRCVSEPKIVPRETKLSLQRKSMLDPHYKLKKLFEKSSVDLERNGNENRREVTRAGKNKPSKYCPNIVIHSCLDISSARNTTGLAPFSPLVRGLDSWLKKRGKRFTSFVGLKNVATKDPVSFLKLPDLDERESSETSTTISSASNVENCGLNNEGKDIKILLEGGLNDLCTLIRMGYPITKCEVWLTAMRDHYPDLSRYPLYWECRASINSKMGMKRNVDNNNKDIPVQLNDLVNKLKDLNLDTKKNDEVETEFKTPKKCRVLADISVNNVLNSSSIQFSVKKKDKNEDSFVVTPVRRSARKCQCGEQKKNENHCVLSSLLELSDDVRENMKFEPNLALK